MVFLLFFLNYSYRLGIQPFFMHDDYEYTYPSFSLAERGDFGSPLLGTSFNLAKRTYHFTIYYYATVHAGLIRIFGNGPEAIPLANTLHFSLLAAGGALLLISRRAYLGTCAFLCSLVNDDRMIDAARHGRPEMTAGVGLVAGVVALWIWYGEGQWRPLVLFAMGAAFTAGILSHTAVLFFVLPLLLGFAAPLARHARPRDVVVALLPYTTIPILYSYFILTDNFGNVWGQLAPQQGNVLLGHLLTLVRNKEWNMLAGLSAEFLQLHVDSVGIWLGIVICLTLPAFAPCIQSRAARFFAGVYLGCLGVHFLFLKHFVLSYRVFYQATFFLALAFAAEAVTIWLGEKTKPALVAVLRGLAIALLLYVSADAVAQFRSRLKGQQVPYGRLQGVLVYALAESGAQPGDRVFVPAPFAFHLQRNFDVLSYPPNWRYLLGGWDPAFREGLRGVWGNETLANVDPKSLCWAMGLAFIRPRWVVSWNWDYSIIQPFRDFLRQFPALPGMELVEVSRAPLPLPYGGAVRVYRLTLSDIIRDLDRTPYGAQASCP